jgi:predicted small lipoprotein YifL
MRTTALVGILLLSLAAAACGRYGPPLRAQEYRDAQKERDAARQKEAEKSDQETNAPMPPSP